VATSSSSKVDRSRAIESNERVDCARSVIQFRIAITLSTPFSRCDDLIVKFDIVIQLERRRRRSVSFASPAPNNARFRLISDRRRPRAVAPSPRRHTVDQSVPLPNLHELESRQKLIPENHLPTH